MKLFSVFQLAIFFCFASNNHQENVGIKIVVDNLRSNAGHVLISLYNSDEGYPDTPDKAVRKGKLIIKDNKAWIKFTGLPAGNYAVAILHDENDDQKMNTNFFGLPKEGYGFSNNVMGTFGPPSFEKASFSYTTNRATEIIIKAKY
jgi:uncharacterized protein (DUF2141 family)